MPATPHRPRIATGGIGIESSVYSPMRSGVDHFVRRAGDAYFEQYPFLAVGQPLREAASWLPTVHFRAIPGGPVPLDAFWEMANQILDGLDALLAEGPLDGFLYDIHGAMSVVGLDDPEGVLAARIRVKVGDKTLISTGMDLHGNVSSLLAETVDLLTCYRMAPHEDALDTKERAARNLVERLTGPAQGSKPIKARVAVPVLLPGEKTSTRVEPAKSVYAQVPEIEALPGVLDAAIWIGYAWADEPRNHCAVMVTGDDADAVTAGASRLATAVWDVADDFAFVGPTGTLDECLAAAVTSDKHPFFISDSGDNPTAGGAGDVTWTLARLLEREDVMAGSVDIVYASIPDASGAETAAAAGVGAQVSLDLGARVDSRLEGPAHVEGVVEHVHTGDPAADIEVVIRTGGLRILLTRRRKPYHHVHDFTDNGIDPEAAQIVIVKIGYLEPELNDLAADWLLALTPGGVDQNLERLPHNRIMRPMAPYDSFNTAPDLTPVIVPASGVAAARAALDESGLSDA